MSTAREIGERIKAAMRSSLMSNKVEAEMGLLIDQLVSLAQPGEGALTGWQSIDSAPKDRTLLLWHPSYGTPVAGHVLVGELWGVFAPGVPMLFQKHLEPPTHWMPLPPPPGITSTPTGDSNG